MDGRSIGIVLIAFGALAMVVGALVYFGFFDWFGRLPGDIRVESERTRFYVPITSMILVSIVLSALLWVWRRFF
jgi:hypothetical protein